MQTFENLVEMGNRAQIEVADKIVVAGDLVAGHTFGDFLDQSFNQGELACEGLHPHDRLDRIAQRRGVKVDGEPPDDAAVFESLQAFAAARSRESDLRCQRSYGSA